MAGKTKKMPRKNKTPRSEACARSAYKKKRTPKSEGCGA